jgi:hypothetical protein
MISISNKYIGDDGQEQKNYTNAGFTHSKCIIQPFVGLFA